MVKLMRRSTLLSREISDMEEVIREAMRNHGVEDEDLFKAILLNAKENHISSKELYSFANTMILSFELHNKAC